MRQASKVIKYEGNNDVFVWKHPCEDFDGNTQLIVHESQEALFFMNGQALDLFGAGRYTLESETVPLLSKILNRLSGSDSPFHSEVYFINKTEQMAIKWGTDSKVEYIDPKYGFPVAIGASGEMSMSVDNSRKLLQKLVGTEHIFDRQKLTLFFRGVLMSKVKSYMAQIMKENSISIFEIDENLTLFSESLHQLLTPDFAEYGICLENFFVTNIVRPDGEKQYEQFKELHFRQFADVAQAKLHQQVELINAQTEAQKTVIASQAMATKRSQEGYTYQQERGFDAILESAKKEPASPFLHVDLGYKTLNDVYEELTELINTETDPKITQEVKTERPCKKSTAEAKEEAELCGQSEPSNLPQEYCENCGYKFERPGNFCPKCGAKRG